MRNTSSRSVVITGTSSGIGAECAIELARRGWHVFAGVRHLDDAEHVQQHAAECGGTIRPLLIDVTDKTAIDAAVATVSEAVGTAGLDALVNNAGIVVAGPLEILPLDSFRRQLEVNVVGVLAMTQAFAPLLRAPRGRVVNISSVNGAVAPPYLGAYAASKHALEAVSDSLRLELRHWGIEVILVEPGPTRTPIWQKSAAATDDIAAQVAPELLTMYQDEFTAVREAFAGLAARAVPAERVVRAVVRALGARRPRVRYYTSWESRLSFKGFRMLPDRFRDWMLRRALGLR